MIKHLNPIKRYRFMNNMVEDIKKFIEQNDVPYIELRLVTNKYARPAARWHDGIKEMLRELEKDGKIRIEYNSQFQGLVYVNDETDAEEILA